MIIMMILCLFSWIILCDANLDCQLKGILNTHENKPLSIFKREFLDLFNWNGKTHPVTSSTTPLDWVPSRTQRRKRIEMQIFIALCFVPYTVWPIYLNSCCHAAPATTGCGSNCGPTWTLLPEVALVSVLEKSNWYTLKLTKTPRSRCILWVSKELRTKEWTQKVGK